MPNKLNSSRHGYQHITRDVLLFQAEDGYRDYGSFESVVGIYIHAVSKAGIHNEQDPDFASTPKNWKYDRISREIGRAPRTPCALWEVMMDEKQRARVEENEEVISARKLLDELGIKMEKVK